MLRVIILEIRRERPTGCGHTEHRYLWRRHHRTSGTQWSWKNNHNLYANWL